MKVLIKKVPKLKKANMIPNKHINLEIKQGIPKTERNNAIEWSFEYFREFVDKENYYSLLSSETNWDISAKLVDENNKLMGLYLLGNKQLSSVIGDNELDFFKGVEGIMLIVDKSARELGWGNRLKDYPKTLDGIDYIWGSQFKSLNNLRDWLKRRKLICETKYINVTMEFFNE